MTIERLTDNPLLPQSGEMILSGDPDRQAQYIRELVGDLESDKLTDIHRRINLILETQNDTIVYLGLKNALGEYDDGTWRINGDSDSVITLQLMISGSWVTIDTLNQDYATASPTEDYDASFDDMLLCDGTFTVTLPDIPTYMIGKSVCIVNIGTGIITVDGYGDDTIYDELEIEAIPEATLTLRAATSTTWVLT